ncbi:MAG: pyridoxamine 5'-phosphate oxidase [Sediminibacterium sp.]|jgi:pyridoxamine 5'-phosphate oxidase|nr:pyridoxamine 5'-phosphate oxidase [Chitinophagaceae bacterium]
MNNIADIRRDYKLRSFDEKDAAANPFDQFDSWWQEAITSDIDEVNAMTLGTVNAAGNVSTRIVLLKGYTREGFVFFTNYHSSKGNAIAAHPQVSLLFFWKELERQVRIEGITEKISSEESDTYFKSRPEGSKIGAWASPQSSIIESRAILEKNVVKYTAAFEGADIPRPDHWGGYIVKPNTIEFWQGRSSRLHDRIRYQKENSDWIRERLAP